MIDKHGEPMVVARAAWLDEDLPVEERIASLAVEAAQESLYPIADRLAGMHDQLGIHLAISAENLPDAAQRQRIVGDFMQTLRFGTVARPVELVVEGHAGGFLGLENARRQLLDREAMLCLVGGADSYMDPMRLKAIDLAGRLHSANYSWGFTPGEGAGFCILATGRTAFDLGLPLLAEMRAVATATEANLMGTDAVCIGDGLTAVFRAVLDQREAVSHSFCDFNGETYRADEYGFTISRTSECFEDAGSFTAAADCWGDVGSASGVLALTLPVATWQRGYSKGPVSLVWASSARASLRGAALLMQCAAARV
jgi:3-oxoacyl-[acyl-carrier-protein] synthase-1